MYRITFYIVVVGAAMLVLACSGGNTIVPKQQQVAAIKEDSNATWPLVYLPCNCADGQQAFESVVAHMLPVQIFGNNEARQAQRVHQLQSMLGVTHFFMDYDLTTGYVHPYTLNFFNKLPADGFVLKFEPNVQVATVGAIRYIRKSEMQATDTLGRNIAFFRQWKLSEIDYRVQDGKVEVNLGTTHFAGRMFIQAKAGISNPYQPDIPLWVQYNNAGYAPLSRFNKLDNSNGGTVVFVWFDKATGAVLFQDMHAPLEAIINRAIEIADNYKVDPVIGIYDAAPMARKFRANQKWELNTDQFAPGLPGYVGAGFGYVKSTRKG